MDLYQCNPFLSRYSLSLPKAHVCLEVETPEQEQKPLKKLSFFRKFFELQGLMIHHNNQLTKSHPYSSAPISWPFVIRGKELVFIL
jgi:dolichyl-phosphate-mannose--protein O-mannosyl transferase